MLERNPNSKKGDNGRVLVIGGSETFYGAPILSALAAEATGVDLVYPWLPPMHVEAAKKYSLNFIIQEFKQNHLSPEDTGPILKSSEKMDAVVIGPGLGTHPDTKKAVKNLLGHLTVPTVIDASALLYTQKLPEVTVLTPHRGEFKEITGEDASPESVQKWAKHLGVIMVCKGPEDIMAWNKELAINKTGNAFMTVGGTGDTLAGLIAGLIAQKMEPFEAVKLATKLLGKIADEIAKQQHGVKAQMLIANIPEALQHLS